MDINDEGHAKIVEEGNPDFIWIHDGEVMKPQFESIPSKYVPNNSLLREFIGGSVFGD